MHYIPVLGVVDAVDWNSTVGDVVVLGIVAVGQCCNVGLGGDEMFDGEHFEPAVGYFASSYAVG